jgi:hypothetical protein
LPDLTTLMPSIELTWDGTADRQKYNICLLGEKTGLRSILQPLAKQFSASLLLPSGEPSITMLHGLVDRAITDGRPLRILTFTDCDPTGQGIPASVGRRVQAMLALAGSKLDVQVISAGLTVEQADALGLPDSAIKETDKRAKKWEAATGRGQTEIDALLALRPDVLEKMARDAIAPFYDADLAWRAKEARDAWEAEARRIVATALDDMPAHKAALQRLQDQHAAYAEAHAEIDEVIDNLREAMEQATEQAAMPELPTLPKWQAPDVPMLPVLFDSADSFVANTRRMQQAKLAGDAEDEQPDND